MLFNSCRSQNIEQCIHVLPWLVSITITCPQGQLVVDLVLQPDRVDIDVLPAKAEAIITAKSTFRVADNLAEAINPAIK